MSAEWCSWEDEGVMEFLSDDPTYVAGTLAVLAGIFGIALRVTQQGKYLIAAVAALSLALLVVLIEQLWVTDAERIEAKVYALGQAVAASDTNTVFEILADDVEYVSGDNTLPPAETREMVTRTLANAKFDFLRISKLRTRVGSQSRRGTADFQVLCSGSFNTPYNDLNFATSNSTWSLAFKEYGPNNWKVVRITPVYIPGGQYVLPSPRAPRASSPAIPDFGGPVPNFGQPTTGRRRGFGGR